MQPPPRPDKPLRVKHRPSPEDVRPENFQPRKVQKPRDKLAVFTAVLAGVVVAGGGLYYFTRPAGERQQLRADLTQQLTKPAETKPAQLREATEVAEAMGETAAAPAARPAETTPDARPATAYAGGSPTRILPADNPKLPPASADFLKFAEALRVSGVVPGNPARVMLNGKLFRGGDTVDAALGVRFIGVETAPRKCFILRDATGAELKLTY